MSNDVMNESFFANKQIPMCEKLGLMSLVLGGTYDKNAISFDGKSTCFSSMVCNRGGTKTSVIFTYGHPESLSAMACKTYIHNMGLDKVMSVENMFSGSLSDSEIIGNLEEYYKKNPNIDKSKFPDNFESLRSPKIKDYLEQLKKSNSYLADTPKISENIFDKIQEVCGGKKKQMTN